MAARLPPAASRPLEGLVAGSCSYEPATPIGTPRRTKRLHITPLTTRRPQRPPEHRGPSGRRRYAICAIVPPDFGDRIGRVIRIAVPPAAYAAIADRASERAASGALFVCSLARTLRRS